MPFIVPYGSSIPGSWNPTTGTKRAAEGSSNPTGNQPPAKVHKALHTTVKPIQSNLDRTVTLQEATDDKKKQTMASEKEKPKTQPRLPMDFRGPSPPKSDPDSDSEGGISCAQGTKPSPELCGQQVPQVSERQITIKYTLNKVFLEHQKRSFDTETFTFSKFLPEGLDADELDEEALRKIFDNDKIDINLLPKNIQEEADLAVFNYFQKLKMVDTSASGILKNRTMTPNVSDALVEMFVLREKLLSDKEALTALTADPGNTNLYQKGFGIKHVLPMVLTKWSTFVDYEKLLPGTLDKERSDLETASKQISDQYMSDSANLALTWTTTMFQQIDTEIKKRVNELPPATKDATWAEVKTKGQKLAQERYPVDSPNPPNRLNPQGKPNRGNSFRGRGQRGYRPYRRGGNKT